MKSRVHSNEHYIETRLQKDDTLCIINVKTQPNALYVSHTWKKYYDRFQIHL